VNVEFVNPFVDSVRDLFATLLSAKAVRTAISVTEGHQMSGAHCGFVYRSSRISSFHRVLPEEIRFLEIMQLSAEFRYIECR
jgi:hypothetical protein